jgi:putative SOS response-associated peptidase YedK
MNCPRCVGPQRPINARSETAAKSGMFRGALLSDAASSQQTFYEWRVVEGGKQPYAIARQDGQPMAFAGLWESFRWPDETVLRTFTIMTTTPNAEMSELHDRMRRRSWTSRTGRRGLGR